MSNNLDLRTPDERAHAVLSASGSHRWVNCPGSVALSLLFVDPRLKRGQTEYAAEGSAAHYLCEICLESGLDPRVYLNYKVVPEGPIFDPDIDDDLIREETGQEYVFVVTEEMADAVEMYCNYIDEIKTTCVYRVEPFIEKSGDLLATWRLVTGKEPKHQWLRNMFGTSDYILEAFIDGVLHIVDFKYGAGIAVDPEENDQLMYYAAAHAGENLLSFDEIHLHIVQPRAWHADGECRSWVTSGEYIYNHFKEAVFPAAELCIDLYDSCLQIIDGVQGDPDWEDVVYPHLYVSDETCQWCDAIHICPKVKEANLEMAKADFAVDNPPAKHTDLPFPATASEFSKFMHYLPIIKKWIKAVEAGAENFTANGHTIPGFKRVAKRGTRKWTNEQEVLDYCKKKRMKKGDYMKESLLTPAQLEKVVADKEGIQQFIFTEVNGTTLAPESDSRPEVRIDAAADFDDDEDELAIPGR